MTNKKHSAKVSEVWKPMTLVEAVGRLRPQRYAETNAGSPIYPLADHGERAFGVRGFMRWSAEDPSLTSTHYFAQLRGRPGLEVYPGSPGG